MREESNFNSLDTKNKGRATKIFLFSLKKKTQTAKSMPRDEQKGVLCGKVRMAWMVVEVSVNGWIPLGSPEKVAELLAAYLCKPEEGSSPSRNHSSPSKLVDVALLQLKDGPIRSSRSHVKAPLVLTDRAKHSETFCKTICGVLCFPLECFLLLLFPLNGITTVRGF